MADGTRLDPDGARRLFNRIAAVMDGLDEARHQVEEVRANVHKPWGDDDAGKEFEQREPNTLTTLRYIGEIAGSGRELSDIGKRMVDEFVKADEDNARAIDREA